MKKRTLILALLSTFTGIASAASGVTFYGKVEAAYQGTNTKTHTYNAPSACLPAGSTCITGFPSNDKSSSNHAFIQGAEGESRIGIKGNEDLGNGMAAFFQLESKINGDTGVQSGSEFFSEKSVVGLSFGNGKHSVYFGRSASPIDRIGFSTDHLSSGLGWKSSLGNWQNAAFYDYSSNGLSVMAAVTTKGGATASFEGESGNKPAYGVSVKYTGSNFAVAAGYQKDNSTGNFQCNSGNCSGWTNAIGPINKSEWGVGAQYTFNPVTVSASYADAKTFYGAKERRIHSTISTKLTSNDTLFANFLRDKTTYTDANFSSSATHFGLGYIHALSKRTELFANIGRDKTKSSTRYTNYTSNSNTTKTAYDFGIRHSF